jgi:hypothetical protein
MSAFSDMIRAQSQGKSEDFQRFSNDQIDAWQSAYDPTSGGFRSEGGGGALVDKPTDCPYGTTLHGSKCISWDQANQMFGGGYGPGASAQPNQLGQMMATMPAASPVGGPTAGPWGETGGQSPQDLAAMLTPYLNLPQQQTQQPLVSATQNMLAPQQNKPAQSLVPTSLGTGWSTGQDGLTKMMAAQQRRGQMGQLPNGAGGSWWA